MKKNLFFSVMAAAVVMLLASCTDNKELLANMVGTYTDNDAEEKVTVQFYPSADEQTGKFVEKREVVLDGTDGDDIELNIKTTVYITGVYTLTADRRISYKYDLDKLAIFLDEEDMVGYTQRNIEFNDANGNCYEYQGKEMEDIVATLEAAVEEKQMEGWKEFYESENKDFETLSYKDVKCDGTTFSFDANGTVVVYTRLNENMFDDDFFDEKKGEEEKVEEIVDAAEAAGEAE